MAGGQSEWTDRLQLLASHEGDATDAFRGRFQSSWIGANPLTATAVVVCFSSKPENNDQALEAAQRLAERAKREGLVDLSFVVIDDTKIADNPRAWRRLNRANMAFIARCDLGGMRRQGKITIHCVDSPDY